MESTGVYWIPVFDILEQLGFTVVLVNARDAKHVPGRKTDVTDAQWLQRLHEYGLLRASFRPERRIAALRDYLRQRERLLDYAASHIQHMQKALMQMNLQLHPRRVRHYRRDRHAHHPCCRGWRTQPGDAGGVARPALQGVGRDDPTGIGRQ